MAKKTFFAVQEIKLQEPNAPSEVRISQSFDFVAMATSFGEGVSYSKHEILKEKDKWFLVVTFERYIKSTPPLSEFPFRKHKR